MADPYIDQFETIMYGSYARGQMEKVCLGRVPKLDSTVHFAIEQQTGADTAMKAALDKQPVPVAVQNAAAVVEEGRDMLIRFGSYLGSLKGHPLPLKLFFRGERPSDAARRRLVKLVAIVEHIRDEIPKHAAITDPTWAADFQDVAAKLLAVKTATQDAKVEKVDLGPEVAAERERWLTVYNANKHLIRGLLTHAGKPELMPLIFDDLAEIHRVPGVSDSPPVPPAADSLSPS